MNWTRKLNDTNTQFFTKKTFKFTIDQKQNESENSKTKPEKKIEQDEHNAHYQSFSYNR